MGSYFLHHLKLVTDLTLHLQGFYFYCRVIKSSFTYIMELKMNRLLISVVFVIFCFYPYLARANTNRLAVSQSNLPVASQPAVSVPDPSIPDISGWTVVNISRIELRISDNTVAYIGLEIEYNNPANPREFIQVTRRHIPLILSKPKQSNRRLLSEMADVFYNQKEEQDRLNESSDKSDPIVYVRWQTRRNSYTGRDALNGDVDIWFMPPDGNWRFVKNEKKAVEFLTENVGNGKLRNVFSGMKYQVGDVYHMLRAARSDIIRVLEERRSK